MKKLAVISFIMLLLTFLDEYILGSFGVYYRAWVVYLKLISIIAFSVLLFISLLIITTRQKENKEYKVKIISLLICTFLSFLLCFALTFVSIIALSVYAPEEIEVVTEDGRKYVVEQGVSYSAEESIEYYNYINWFIRGAKVVKIIEKNSES
jgi:hypothetical protein